MCPGTAGCRERGGPAGTGVRIVRVLRRIAMTSPR
jgi:hypothetical protein